MTAQQVAVIGGGWAGLAAAVTATQAGHRVTLFEATRHWGGRARSVDPDSATTSATAASTRNPLKHQLDNGQHILIGAYTHTLALLRAVGIQPSTVLHRMPLTLLYPDGNGLRLSQWPAPLNLLTGILSARGWTLADKTALLNTARTWQRAGFTCPDSLTVAALCQNLPPTIRQQLMEPLCLSALNTPPERASAQVFLRVLQDALMAGRGSSNLLLPRTDLSQLLPTPAALWLEQRGAQLRLGQRVQSLERAVGQWQVNDAAFDTVILATPASVACQLLQELLNKTRSQNAAPDAEMQR
ncbi:MAG: FAD-dependent oxidoreductase, partial [Rhodoferax sp.]|nr:FAD-dependent oxidoreductase [Rhodoferax sp.]